MKHHLTVIVDILTIVLVVPFMLFMVTITGLVIALAFDLDAYFIPSTKAETQLHIRRLPPLKLMPAVEVRPAPALIEHEPVTVTVPSFVIEPEPQEVVIATDIQPAQTEVEPDSADAAVSWMAAEAAIEDTAVAAETTSPEEITSGPADILAVADTNIEVTENPAAADPVEVTAAETIEETAEVSLSEAETPAIVSIAQSNPPAPPPPAEPAPVPDVSYFDKLLEQVKQ